MDRDEKIRLIEKHYRTFWTGDPAEIDRELTPDFVDSAAPPGTPPGTEYVKAAAMGARAGFPDMVVTVEETIVDGPVVAVRARWRGTNTGPMMGRPPTGKKVDVTGIVVWKLADDGRIARRDAFLDMGAFAKQLAD